MILVDSNSESFMIWLIWKCLLGVSLTNISDSESKLILRCNIEPTMIDKPLSFVVGTRQSEATLALRHITGDICVGEIESKNQCNLLLKWSRCRKIYVQVVLMECMLLSFSFPFVNKWPISHVLQKSL